VKQAQIIREFEGKEGGRRVVPVILESAAIRDEIAGSSNKNRPKSI